MEDSTNVSEDTEKSSSENGDIMICFAKPRCLAPSASEEDWIQCNGCTLDFHKHCVGVLPDQVLPSLLIILSCFPNQEKVSTPVVDL